MSYLSPTRCEALRKAVCEADAIEAMKVLPEGRVPPQSLRDAMKALATIQFHYTLLSTALRQFKQDATHTDPLNSGWDEGTVNQFLSITKTTIKQDTYHTLNNL